MVGFLENNVLSYFTAYLAVVEEDYREYTGKELRQGREAFMYDLTSFLTTISAGSASFVAILGGLIAQKVIEINNGRTAVVEEIRELNEQKHLLEDDIAVHEDWIAEDSGISFIIQHIKELLGGEIFSDAVDLNEMSGHENLESLASYWNDAQKVLEQYVKMAEKPHYELVKAIQGELPDISENFVSCICDAIKDHFKAYYHNNGLTSSGQFMVTQIDLGIIEGYGASSIEYQRWVNEMNKAKGELAAIELRIKQSEDRKRRLRVPEELKSGFWVFGLFIVGCVLLPLAFTPFTTESSAVYVIMKVVFLVIFGCGLFSVLFYIRKLLPRFKDK